mgnify:CR=1 FL=1
MKTIISTIDLISYYIFEDSQEVLEEGEDFVVITTNRTMQIEKNNMALIEDISEPSNYKPAKYKLIDNEWVLNPSYIPTE